MKYRKDRYGNEISVLGFGCMRFTSRAGRFDYEKAQSEVMRAYELGVNYYDTAYIYPGSEVLMGKIFANNGIRDRVNIATKLPHYMVTKPGDFDKYFDEQLRRLQTNHVEYYLMHMLNDAKSWQRVVDLGAIEWLEKKKAEGSIKQVGFSYHGNSDKFRELLDAYDWDFCQIQYNYYDEHSQAGRSGYEYAYSKGIPVIIMEPLRGGKLVNLPKEAQSLFEKYDEEHYKNSTPVKSTASGIDGVLRMSASSPAKWGLRWLWNQPGVTCVLSGMNSIEMVEENCATVDSAVASSLRLNDNYEYESISDSEKIMPAGFISEKELGIYSEVVKKISAKTKVPCTGCRYCMPCPKNVDIPGTFSAYNNRYVDGWFTAEKEYMMCTTLRKEITAASNCIGCGKCEEHCPQHIEIRKELKNARKVLEGIPYKVAKKLAPIVYRY